MSQVITVYHGGSSLVQIPEIRPVSRPMDFGAGFYTTTLALKQSNGHGRSR